MDEPSIYLELQDEIAAALLAEDLALALKPGDLIMLSGDLGAGKTTIARGLIRASNDDLTLEVPSPTFTLVQEYPPNKPLGTITHIDLYRLEEAEEVEQLGISEALDTGIALVEWPERAEEFLPQGGLNISITHLDAHSRSVQISGNSAILERVERSLAIRRFLDTNWQENATRRYLLGDASSRTYETVSIGLDRRILMNSPSMADGPVIRDGKPYSQIAHLAEDVRPFVAIAQLLRQEGFQTPEIFARDMEAGFLLISHLGNEGVLDQHGLPDQDKYVAAVETLAKLHAIKWPDRVKMKDGIDHRIPAYDQVAMMIETDLLIQWYLPRVNGKPADDATQRQFDEIWKNLTSRLEIFDKTLTLRDFHSPNILWLKENSGTDRVGLIDFQDAVIGPCAYDFASLAQDARVTVSPELEQVLIDTYLTARANNNPQFDSAGFLESYAIISAQRATKLLGIFVRLDQRDNKPAYLAHLPRLKTYLRKCLEHPALTELKQWYCDNTDVLTSGSD